MRVQHIARMADVAAEHWDALFDADFPFTRHAFLRALEDHRCVGEAKGWTPAHLLLHDDAGALCGASPLYVKGHSYGEFVFDFAWARAAENAGLDYYPKLLTAVPFVPSTGPRLGAVDAPARAALMQALLALPKTAGLSSWHGLFLTPTDFTAAREAGALLRHDIQFQWANAGYGRFEDFLARLTAEKRKKIRQERRKLSDAGLRFDTLPGDAFSEADWAELYALYANTYEERGQPPYLSLDFFLDYARAPDTPVRVTVAREGPRFVAMALLLQGQSTLYGRHWGAAEHYSGLHFETCYYQGIEYAIRERLARYDAGTQGEHKLARGFEPVMTTSAHSLLHPGLHAAVQRALRQEAPYQQARLAEYQARSAYKTLEAA